MSEDQSLTDFSASETTSDTDEGGDSEAAAPVEPAFVTYRCRPDGFVCTACEVETTKQWLDDGQFVCPDCKSWA